MQVKVLQPVLKELQGVFKNIFDFDKKSIQSAVNEASSTVEAVTNIIKFVINIFGKKLTALRLQIQIFLLKANKYVKQTITRMANALTGNTATDKEIETFQSQAQKFITLMLVWYFVYNWYYIIFFLEDSDNIRYSFKIGNLKAISTYLYGFFGPGLKPIEIFNSMVVYCQNLKKYVNTSVIMIIMFLVFFILVQNDFQTSLLKDFFGALSGKPTPSILSLFNMGVVLWFSFSWFFGKLSHGNFECNQIICRCISRRRMVDRICMCYVCISIFRVFLMDNECKYAYGYDIIVWLFGIIYLLWCIFL